MKTSFQSTSTNPNASSETTRIGRKERGGVVALVELVVLVEIGTIVVIVAIGEETPR